MLETLVESCCLVIYPGKFVLAVLAGWCLGGGQRKDALFFFAHSKFLANLFVFLGAADAEVFSLAIHNNQLTIDDIEFHLNYLKKKFLL